MSVSLAPGASVARPPSAAPARPQWQTVWWLAFWLAGPGNLPLWQRILSVSDTVGQAAWLLAGFGLLIAACMAALLSLMAWPRVLRPVATLLVVVTAFNSYFMWEYGVVIDATMLANVANTDAREVRDLLSWSLLAALLLVAGPALWWLWRRPLETRGWWPQAGRNAVGAVVALGLVVATGLVGYQGLASLMRNHKDMRYMVNPLNSVYATARLATRQASAMGRGLQPVGEDARLGASYTAQARPPLLVFVVGETARAENWGLNGYARPTTPALSRWQAQGDLVNFSQVSSCGTNTQVSVPCIFSPLGRDEGGNETATRENLLDVLQRAGLAVLWVDNQSGCKGVCDRVPNINLHDDPSRHGCQGDGCFDDAMLEGLDARIAALDPQRRARGVVVVMHQMGSHGPAYFKRAPAGAKPFLPECLSVTLTDCLPEQLLNGYDNSIAATDAFLDRTLTWLKAQSTEGSYDTGLIYVSDHGESLGENGLYLHGVPYAFAPRQQTHVPMVTWLSAGLQQRTGVRSDCLRQRAAEPLSHDNVFHTVLGVMDVETRVRQDALDMLAPCAVAHLHHNGSEVASVGDVAR
jgi:lipid A ethanolaminephosphotransferase